MSADVAWVCGNSTSFNPHRDGHLNPTNEEISLESITGKRLVLSSNSSIAMRRTFDGTPILSQRYSNRINSIDDALVVFSGTVLI
jgi:hypothetical protein